MPAPSAAPECSREASEPHFPEIGGAVALLFVAVLLSYAVGTGGALAHRTLPAAPTPQN